MPDHVADEHPLAALLDAAAAGRHPSADGRTAIVGAPSTNLDAVVAFTAHHVVATRVAPTEVTTQLRTDDIAAAMHPDFLSWLGRRLGTSAGTLDLMLATHGVGGAPPASAAPGLRHPRIDRARAYRTDVSVHGDHEGFVTVGRGLVGRWEVSIEVSPATRGSGRGRHLAALARRAVPAGEALFAQVSPGNVASVRAFLAAGYAPIGAEVLFLAESS